MVYLFHDIIYATIIVMNLLFFSFFFLTWTILKVFIEFVPTLLVFYVLVFWPRSMLDLSSLTSDQTRTPGIGRWILNHWTVTEAQMHNSYSKDRTAEF